MKTIALIALLLLHPVTATAQDPAPPANVNAKYIVDDVDVRGVDMDDLPASLRDEIAALIGKPLDVIAAERIADRLRTAFPDHDVEQRQTRGETRGRLRIIYSLRRADRQRWLRFEPTGGHVVYHGDQGWGALLPISISGGNTHLMPIFAWGTSEHGIEHYSGFGLRLESRRLATERLGLSLEWSSYAQHWRDRTLEALPLTPLPAGAYDRRRSLTPLVKFAFTPQLSIAAGVSVNQLEPPEGGLLAESSAANVAIGSLRYRQQWGAHALGAALTLRAGRSALDSDFEYDRYVGHVGYTLQRGDHHLLLSATGGRVDGTAPLFERFALGDAHTLRGWDKFAITPLGGTRMVNTSLEYRVNALQLFVDAGSVWDAGAARKVRVSTGVGVASGPAFFTVAVPLDASDLGAVVTLGVRFGFSAAAVSKH